MEIIYIMIFGAYVCGIGSMTIVFKLMDNVTTLRAMLASTIGCTVILIFGLALTLDWAELVYVR